MQGGLVARKVSVCLYAWSSVRQTRELWQNGRKICPDRYLFVLIRDRVMQPNTSVSSVDERLIYRPKDHLA